MFLDNQCILYFPYILHSTFSFACYQPGMFCFVCDNNGTFICCRCGAMRYCSKACQREHWRAPGGHWKRCNPGKTTFLLFQFLFLVFLHFLPHVYFFRLSFSHTHTYHSAISANPLAKPYIFDPPDTVYRTVVWRVSDFQEGPDQPMDPPPGEEWDFIREMWRYVCSLICCVL